MSRRDEEVRRLRRRTERTNRRQKALCLATVSAAGFSAWATPPANAAAARTEARASLMSVNASGARLAAQIQRCFRHAARRLPTVVRPRTMRSATDTATLPPAGLRRGMSGWQVAALQLLIAEHGFPSGSIDGSFGPRTESAVRRYQRWLGLVADGVAGRETLAALTTPPPRPLRYLRWPVQAPVTSRFGPRGGAFHAGIDLGAPEGRAVAAAERGRVTWAAWRDGGWGNLVVVAHGGGLRSFYAHLSSIEVRVGQVVGAGARLGRVGRSGHATGPHLHFEVRLRGASVNPQLVLEYT